MFSRFGVERLVIFMSVFEDEMILKKHYRKELLSLYRETFTAISKITLKSLSIRFSANFGKDKFGFEISVYKDGGDNRSFTLYDFYDLKKNKQIVSDTIACIKTDNFQKVVELSGY